MKTVIVGSQEVARLLPMSECIEVMETALRTLALGDAVLPLRQIVMQPDKKGMLGLMPGYLGGPHNVLGVKVVSVFPGNHGTQFDSHQGAIQLFETQHGQPLAIIDAGSITAIRTAAVSAVATRLLARQDAKSLAILGSGTQAKMHLEAMLLARKGIQDVRVWSRNHDNAIRFAERESKKWQIEVKASQNADEIVPNADIICTTTAATSPVLKGVWLSEGAHINAIGASVPPFRELDTEAIVRGKLFVDRRQSAMEEADDFRIPKKEGAIEDSHIRGEIGEILLGKIHGRTNDREITIFKSLGLSVEDLAAAHHVYTQALLKEAGSLVDMAGERQE